MGITMGFQLSIVAIGSLVLQYAINGLGSDAVAAYTVSMRVDMMAVAPLQSIGLGMATYVAQNRGARQWPRIRVGVFRMSLVSAGVALVMGAVIVLFGIKIVGLFVGADEPDVLAMSHQFLLVNGPLYAFLGMVFFFRNTVQGLGNTTVPTIAGLLELVIRSSVALLLVPHLGFLACVLAGPSAWIGALLVIVPAWFYHRKDLKRKEADATSPIDMPLLAEPSRV
jgi:Na+-driven multidrug efflux pump